MIAILFSVLISLVGGMPFEFAQTGLNPNQDTAPSEDALQEQGLGLESSERKDYQEAISHFTNAIMIQETAESFFYRAMAYRLTDECELAGDDLASAIGLDSSIVEPSIYDSVSTCLLQQEKQLQLIELAESISVTNLPSDLAYSVLVSSSSALVMLSRDAEAIVDSSLAVTIDPIREDAYGIRAHAYVGLYQTRNAIKDFLKVLDIDPDDPMPHVFLGDLYYFEGMYADALREYQTALENPALPSERISEVTSQIETVGAIVRGEKPQLCAWFARSQIVRIERISGTRELMTWLTANAYDAEVLSDEGSIASLVDALRELRPFLVNFLNEWAQIGFVNGAIDFWVAENLSVVRQLSAATASIKAFDEGRNEDLEEALLALFSLQDGEATRQMMLVHDACNP